MFTSKATESGLTPHLKELFVGHQKLVLRLKHRVGIDGQIALHIAIKGSMAKRSELDANLIYHSMNGNNRRNSVRSSCFDWLEVFGVKAKLIKNIWRFQEYTECEEINSV